MIENKNVLLYHTQGHILWRLGVQMRLLEVELCYPLVRTSSKQARMEQSHGPHVIMCRRHVDPPPIASLPATSHIHTTHLRYQMHNVAHSSSSRCIWAINAKHHHGNQTFLWPWSGFSFFGQMLLLLHYTTHTNVLAAAFWCGFKKKFTSSSTPFFLRHIYTLNIQSCLWSFLYDGITRKHRWTRMARVHKDKSSDDHHLLGCLWQTRLFESFLIDQTS